MFLQSGKSQLANLPSTSLTSVPGLHEEFTPFSRFPLEIRRKIWGFAAITHARVFELVWCSSEDGLHQLFKVSKEANRVPPIMEVNREAREEGMRIFEKRVLNNCNINIESPFKVEGDKPLFTWFNPDLDTIYFGENTCLRTFADFFSLYWQTKLPKIAFAINKHAQDSCDCNWRSDYWGPINYMHPCLQILRGKLGKDAKYSTFPGSPSTMEVYVVVPSLVYNFAAGNMPNTVTLRDSVHEGLCAGGSPPGATWAEIIRLLRAGRTSRCGPGRWANGGCPDFKFCSFGPSYKDGKGKTLRHHGFILGRKKFEKITRGTFLEDLRLRTGVDIRTGLWSHTEDFPTCFNQTNEVGLFNGTDEGIRECEDEILAHCGDAK
ncbi:hypothetical protein EAE96_001800 [Botrytis aclada]|nr:hypothetical protein EAE96_001800 [Botrytis aclada]